MNRSPNDDDQWAACPPGTLKKIRRRAGQKRPYAAWVLLGTTCCALVFLAARPWGFMPSQRDNAAPLLTCAEVESMWANYRSGTLSQASIRRVDEHLEVCPDCQRRFAQQMAAAGPHRPLPVVLSAAWRTTPATSSG